MLDPSLKHFQDDTTSMMNAPRILVSPTTRTFWYALIDGFVDIHTYAVFQNKYMILRLMWVPPIWYCRKWAFEKLLFANCNYGFEPVESRKYVLQPRLAWATGVHYSEHLISGREVDVNASLFRSYHYHNTINVRGEVCREFPTGFNGEPNKLNITNCTVDQTMAMLAPIVKQYELAMIGKQPFIL